MRADHYFSDLERAVCAFNVPLISGCESLSMTSAEQSSVSGPMRFLACTLPAALVVAGSVSAACVPSEGASVFSVTPSGVSVVVTSGVVEFDTATLGVRMTRKGASEIIASEPSSTSLGPPAEVTVTASSALWEYPESGVKVALRTTNAGAGVEASISTDRLTSLQWPVSSRDASVRSLEYANGNGQTIPIRDVFWNSDASGLPGSAKDVAGSLTVPAWGVTGSAAQTGAAFYTPTDIGTTLSFTSHDNVLSVSATHLFDSAADTGVYTVVFTPTDGAPTAAALPYRSYLQENGSLATLQEKIASNPETTKLLGAFHAYVAGDGRSVGAIDALKELGIDRMWLGYDASGTRPGADFVAAASQAGYLVAPYDTWANAQDPATADTPASRWPGSLWPDGCVHKADGAPVRGFGNRGCYLSSRALEQAQQARGVLTQRVADFTSNGATSYFLDVDAVGQFFRDFSPAHPQTEAQDRMIRLARMTKLADGSFSGGQKLVLGSESAAAWSNGPLSYSHGSSTSVTDDLWKAQRDKEAWGGFWPDARPPVFFKPVTLSADIATAMFSPKYQVPLYEAVLHDSVISTDRWELSYEKFPALKRDRALTAMLYNTPLNYVLDRRAIQEHGAEMVRLNDFFTVLQNAAGTLPMTDFTTVGPDRMVQQSVFGNGALTVRANFGTAPWDTLQPGCVRAEVPNTTQTELCLP